MQQCTDQSLPDEESDVNDDEEDKENGDANGWNLRQTAPCDAVAFSHQNQHQNEDHIGGCLEQATWKPEHKNDSRTDLNKFP